MTQTIRIAVLDDEPVVRTSIARSIKALGYVPLPCSNETELLDTISSHPPALLVIDQMLGAERTGSELGASLRHDLPHVPIIIVTGFPTSKLAVTVQELDKARMLTKPFSLAELSEAINELLEQT